MNGNLGYPFLEIKLHIAKYFVFHNGNIKYDDDDFSFILKMANHKYLVVILQII